MACLAGLAGLAMLAASLTAQAKIVSAPRAAVAGGLASRAHAIPEATSRLAESQDSGQTAPAPSAAAPAAPKPVELPEGDGKPIATEFCQDCHRLTNLTKAHKNLDDWTDTIHTMIDRGARIPDDKIDTLAKYLAANFAPVAAAPAAAATESAAATPAATPTAAPVAAAPAVPAPAAPAPAQTAVVLPDGPGKAIATENCQLCHKLTNLTKAHKSLDDWKDTVQLMIDRGANVPADQIDTLVQYLAKNFGPKDVTSPAPAPAPAAPTPVTTGQ